MARKFTGSSLILATHNAGKIKELRDVLAPFVASIQTSEELNLPEPDETGVTFRENATIKAVEIARLTKSPVLADDSGLCITALNGAPGVYTADWAGHPRNFRAAMTRVLQEMGDAPDRSGYFITVLALAWPDGHVEYAEGRIDGTITPTMRGVSGFGYDPIFMPNGHAKTFAEMSLTKKKSISHRSIALQAMLDKCFQR